MCRFKVFGNLHKCVELVKTQWTGFYGIKDYYKRYATSFSLVLFWNTNLMKL